MDEKLIPKIDFNEYSKDKYLLDLGDYEIKEENGKIFAILKKPKYPRTYKECCDILSIQPYYRLRYYTNEHGYNEYATSDNLLSLQDKLNTFGKLIICRNAYWEIAGKQMGLDKPWKPDLTSSGQDRYSINFIFDILHLGKTEYGHRILLVFPTKEMRDAFYKNFKDLIEQCNELL